MSQFVVCMFFISVVAAVAVTCTKFKRNKEKDWQNNVRYKTITTRNGNGNVHMKIHTEEEI